MKKLFYLILATVTVLSCKNNPSQKLLPSVSGKAGEIIVVMDKTPWEGASGAQLREVLASDCPYLAQREPLFTLVNVTPSNFVNLFQVHRNLCLVSIDPQNQEDGIEYLNDVWAHPQCVVKINAHTEEEAIALVQDKSGTIAEVFEQAERDRIIANAKKYPEAGVAPQVAMIFGGTPVFPSGYKLKKKTDNFVWIADEKQYTNQGIFVYSYPAKGTDEDFMLDNIISNRNRVLMQNVPGMFENTYMTTGMVIPPVESFVKYKSFNFAQVRGFWEVENDYMGGPFVSHSFYSQDGSEIIVVEAFVYAPKYDKRQYLRQVESLLYSFEWEK